MHYNTLKVRKIYIYSDSCKTCKLFIIFFYLHMLYAHPLPLPSCIMLLLISHAIITAIGPAYTSYCILFLSFWHCYPEIYTVLLYSVIGNHVQVYTEIQH